MFGNNGLLSYITAGALKSPTSPSTPVKYASPAEIIKDRFYFASFGSKQAMTTFCESVDSKTLMFTVDRVMQYEPFCHDFGPLNIGKLYRFCQIVNMKLEDPETADSKIVVYSCNGSKKRSNLAYLVGAYQVLCLNRSAEEAWNVISKDQPEYLPFRDASMGHCTYKLTVEHCIKAVQTAVKLGFVDWEHFDIESYEHYEKIENGDLTVIIPGKFVHFSGPTDAHKDTEGYPTLNPEHYVPIFKKLGVSEVVRLNQPLYDRNVFIKHGINHHEMYFVDGTTPSQALLEKFLALCDSSKGALAVHCKAGLGRTGTVVGCYLMKRYKITASETIAWLRICRPGSVLGPQQQYLERMQAKMWAAGSLKQETERLLKPKKEPLEHGTPFWMHPWSSTSTDSNNKVVEEDEPEEDSFMLVDEEDEAANACVKSPPVQSTSSTDKTSQGDILMRQKTEAQKHRFLL